MTDFNRWGSSSCGCRIGEELSLNATIHCAEQECCTINSLCSSQDAVVLEDDSFVLSECLGNISALFVSKNDSAEIVINGVISVEPVSISIATR